MFRIQLSNALFLALLYARIQFIQILQSQILRKQQP